MKAKLLIFILFFTYMTTYGQFTGEPFAQIKTFDDYCSYPKDVNICYRVTCEHCSFEYLSCKKINHKKWIPVQLTFTCKNIDSLKLTSKFNNVKLKTENEEINPVAILMIVDDLRNTNKNTIAYMSKEKFEVKDYYFVFKKNIQYDIIFLFEEASIGNILNIEDFVSIQVK